MLNFVLSLSILACSSDGTPPPPPPPTTDSGASISCVAGPAWIDGAVVDGVCLTEYDLTWVCGQRFYRDTCPVLDQYLESRYGAGIVIDAYRCSDDPSQPVDIIVSLDGGAEVTTDIAVFAADSILLGLYHKIGSMEPEYCCSGILSREQWVGESFPLECTNREDLVFDSG
jgi:hypothetical protein